MSQIPIESNTCVVRGHVIDHDGRVLERSAFEATHVLGIPVEPRERTTYVVQNLGYIEVRVFPTGTQLLLAPNAVSHKAIAALFYLLFDHRARVFVFSTPDEQTRWQHVILSDKKEVIRRVSRIADSRDGLSKAFISKPLDPQRAQRGSLLSMVRPRLSACNNLVECRTLCDSLIGSRYTLVRRPPDGSQLVIAHMSDGYRFVRNGYHKIARGWTFQDIGDYDYGQWVSAAHHEALRANVLVAHEVDAFVDWPGYGRLRTRYERILIPFRMADGGQWILSAANNRGDIDLRLRSSHKRA